MLRRGIDIRYIVTSLTGHDPKHLYETVYCARGQAREASLATQNASSTKPSDSGSLVVGAER